MTRETNEDTRTRVSFMEKGYFVCSSFFEVTTHKDPFKKLFNQLLSTNDISYNIIYYEMYIYKNKIKVYRTLYISLSKESVIVIKLNLFLVVVLMLFLNIKKINKFGYFL